MRMPDPDPIYVDDVLTLTGTTYGSVTVENGGELTVQGTHMGPVSVEDGGRINVTGSLMGPLDVHGGAHAHVSGDVFGSLDIDFGGTVEVVQGGRHAGSVGNEGTYLNDGMRAGEFEGNPTVDGPNAWVLRPVRRDGEWHYDIPAR